MDRSGFKRIELDGPGFLPRAAGNPTKLISEQLQKIIEIRQDPAVDRQFTEEAAAFAATNPRVDLGREAGNKVRKGVQLYGCTVVYIYGDMLK